MGNDSTAFPNQKGTRVLILRSSETAAQRHQLLLSNVDRLLWLGPYQAEEFRNRPRIGDRIVAGIKLFDGIHRADPFAESIARAFRQEKGTCERHAVSHNLEPSASFGPHLFRILDLNLMSSTDSNRRSFLLTSAGASAASLAALTATTAEAAVTTRTRRVLTQPGDTILFQGDSITDAKRNRELADKPNNQEAFGTGYAWMAASQMLVGRPELRLKCYNRGISGNKVYQLDERWQADCIDLKPNVLSILIGVNDIWHKLNGDYDGTVEVYENDYQALVKRTQQALPNIKLVICEPFVLNCGAVNADWFPEFDGYRDCGQTRRGETLARCLCHFKQCLTGRLGMPRRSIGRQTASIRPTLAMP